MLPAATAAACSEPSIEDSDPEIVVFLKQSTTPKLVDYESDSTLLCNKQAQSAVSAPASAGFFESFNLRSRGDTGGFVWTLTKIEASPLRFSPRIAEPLKFRRIFVFRKFVFHELTYLSLVALRGKRGREGVYRFGYGYEDDSVDGCCALLQRCKVSCALASLDPMGARYGLGSTIHHVCDCCLASYRRQIETGKLGITSASAVGI